MPVDLVYGSAPGANEVLQGAESMAQQSIDRQQLANQFTTEMARVGVSQGQLGLDANKEAFRQAMSLAPYNKAAANALLSFLGTDPTAFAGAGPGDYTGLAGIGAQILGADSLASNYAAQGDYDNASGQTPPTVPPASAPAYSIDEVTGPDGGGSGDSDDFSGD